MDQQIDTLPLQDEQGRLIGYACEGAQSDANVQQVATSFYFGLQYPIGQQTAAMEYVNQALLENVAKEFHLISGTACHLLLHDGVTLMSHEQSSLVSIQSTVNRVELFQSCQNSDPNVQDCQTMQVILTGLVWNANEMPDVVTYVEGWLLQHQGHPLARIQYLGGQELEDYTVISTGAGRPSYPAYQKDDATNTQVSSNRNHVTGLYKMSPLGIGIVCLLVLAFVGLILAFLRKQRLQKLRDQQQSHPREEEKEEENKANDLIVPEIDEEEGESSSSMQTSSKDELSMTGSTSAMSA